MINYLLRISFQSALGVGSLIGAIYWDGISAVDLLARSGMILVGLIFLIKASAMVIADLRTARYYNRENHNY